MDSQPPDGRPVGSTGQPADPAAKAEKTNDEKRGFSFPPELAAAIALVVAGLAAVGVTGVTLTRAVRNEPMIAWSIILALVAAGLLVLVSLMGKQSAPVSLVLLAPLRLLLLTVIVAATALAIWTGARSINDREQPLVSLQAATDEQHMTTITIDVQATGLQTTDQLLVQLIGLTEFIELDRAKIELCERSWVPSPETMDEYVVKREGGDLDPGPADLLVWNRVGPDQSGAVETTLKVQFPTGTYQGVCAWGPLPNDRGGPGDDRNSAAYLRLNDTAVDESSDTTVPSTGPG
jgi:cytochrome c oxidase subunit IV